MRVKLKKTDKRYFYVYLRFRSKGWSLDSDFLRLLGASVRARVIHTYFPFLLIIYLYYPNIYVFLFIYLIIIDLDLRIFLRITFGDSLFQSPFFSETGMFPETFGYLFFLTFARSAGG